MEKQLRREASASWSQNAFFNREPLYQYDTASIQASDGLQSSLDNIRSVFTKIMWPRLVVLRIHHVLVASLPLMNLSHDGTCGVILEDAAFILSPIGWMLHGIRLLINAMELLQQMFGTWLESKKNISNEQPRVNEHIQSKGTQIGNDCIWVLSALAPATLSYNVALLMLDIAWLTSRSWLELNRLYQNIDSPETADKILLIQRKFILSLVNLLSISGMTITKNHLLPMMMPVMAFNPILLFSFSFLSLLITIISRLLEKYLEDEILNTRQTERPVESNLASQLTVVSFFKKESFSNEEDIREPIHATRSI